jgi:hypothetical protein
MGFRYPIASGSIFRMAKEFARHPLFYIVHLGIGQTLRDPAEVAGYLKGLFRWDR